MDKTPMGVRKSVCASASDYWYMYFELRNRHVA